MAILIDHRKIPRFRIIKRLHDLIHRRVDYDLGRGGNHELRYMETIIQLRTEHDIPDIIQQDDTQQTPRSSTTGKVLRPLREMTFTISPNVISGDTIWKSFSITLSARSKVSTALSLWCVSNSPFCAKRME